MANILNILKENNIKSILVNKGETLFHEEGTCQYVGVVKSGLLTITSFSYEGKEIVYTKVKPGNMFGSNLLFSNHPSYKGDVIALEESEIYLLSKEDVINLLQSNKEFLELYLNYQANAGVKLNSQIKLLTFDSAKDRFMYYLYTCGGVIHYKNITSLAKDIFITREAMSRLLTKLDKELVIAVDKKAKEISQL